MTGDDDLVVFYELDIVFGKQHNAIVITQLPKGNEGASVEIVEDKSLLCRQCQVGGQLKLAVSSNWHDGAIGSQDGKTLGELDEMGKGRLMMKSDKQTSGTRVQDHKSGRGRVWDSSSRRRQVMRNGYV
jgi:hypothetical protein